MVGCCSEWALSFQAIDCCNFSLIYYGDTLAELVSFLNVVCCQENGCAVLVQFFNECSYGSGTLNIKTSSWFI